MPISADFLSPQDRSKRNRQIWDEARRGSLTTCPEFLRSRVLNAQDACQCCKASSLKAVGHLGMLVLDFVSALVSRAIDPTAGGESEDDPLELALSAGLVAFPEVSPMSPGQVVIPETVPDPVIRGIPRSMIGTRGVGLGAVVLLTAEVWKSLAAQDATLEAAQLIANAVPPMVKAATRKGAQACERCVAERVLSQTAPQQRFFGPYRRRA